MTERAPGLTPVRLAIDGVDDGLVLLLAARARLARLAGRLKAHAGVQGRDDAREQQDAWRAADPSRAPATAYLGDDVSIADTAMSPDGRWLLAVTRAKDAEAGDPR